MKKIRQLVLLVSLACCANIVTAQNKENTRHVLPKWIADKGFWVIESNVRTPKSSVVRFYANEQQLIYTEIVEGVVLNVKKRKTLMKLKRVLDKVLYAWEKDGVVKENGELVVAMLGAK